MPAYDAGGKDVFLVKPWSSVQVVTTLKDNLGTYVIHCHNLEHEDHSMMTQFQVVPRAATADSTAASHPRRVHAPGVQCLTGRGGSAIIPRVAPRSPSMLIRPLRPLDLVALASFQRRAGGTEIAARTWPRVEPESGHLPYFQLASGALAQRPGARRAWVAEENGRLAGLAVARARAGGLVWDVVSLHAEPGLEHAAGDLLEEVGAYAGAHGGRRVFLQAPVGARAQDVARRAGFERFTSAELYLLAPGFKVERTDLFEARPRLRADEHDLFQLYMAAVPAPVRSAEAMTLEEWAGLFPGRRFWQPSFGSRQQFVWELGTSLVGWLEITFGQRSQFMELLVHPRYEEAVDRLLRYALLQTSPKAPVYATAREYQPQLASALARAGFKLAQAGRHDLFVKLLAARVREPRLVPANVVGG